MNGRLIGLGVSDLTNNHLDRTGAARIDAAWEGGEVPLAAYGEVAQVFPLNGRGWCDSVLTLGGCWTL